jgi:hypothetical protein
MTSQTGDHMSDEKHVTVGRKRWRVILPTLAIGVAAAVPAQAQVVTPSIYPAPCSGTHCLNAPRGAKIFTGGPATAERGCPTGTVFNPRRGTCKVMPQTPGTP